MKKIPIPIIFGLILILILIGLSGCMGENTEEISDNERFIGTWTQEGSDIWYELSEITEISFKEDKTFTTDTELSGSYDFENNRLILTTDEGQQEINLSYQFSIDYEKVTLIDSNENAASYSKK